MPRPDPSSADVIDAGRRDSGDWHRLRHLLIGEERNSLDALTAKIGDDNRLARSVAEVLPDAIHIRARLDDGLTRALAPLLEESLQRSVRKNPQPLVDALYPIMGPAIRRSITETLAELIQAFNAAIEQSFSPRALKWRLDAWRTGQSYANIVLLKTLVYKVEQVFLIHRESGLLLRHAMASQVIAQDPDMVSGMLTAIRDFVGDSFQVNHEDGVDSIRLGEFWIQVRVGPQAVLAVVGRGAAAESLQTLLSQTLEEIHRTQWPALNGFAGDSAPFAAVDPLLRACLVEQSRETALPARWGSWLVLAAIALLLTGWAYSHHRTTVGWNQVLTDLGHEPGLVVLDAGSATPAHLHGLRDPLARDPRAVIGTDRLRRYGIVEDWKPYLSLDPAIVLARAEHLLIPPGGLTLHFEQDALRATGTAPASWLRDARIRAPLIPGVGTFDTSAVAVDNQRTFAAARDKLNAMALYFNTGSHELSDADLARFDDIVPSIADLRDSAAALQMDYRVDVVGRADAPGTTEHNLQLSQSRADAVREALIAHGMSPQRVHARGIGAPDGASGSTLDSANATAYSQFLNSDRRVNLTVVAKMPPSSSQ